MIIPYMKPMGVWTPVFTEARSPPPTCKKLTTPRLLCWTTWSYWFFLKPRNFPQWNIYLNTRFQKIHITFPQFNPSLGGWLLSAHDPRVDDTCVIPTSKFMGKHYMWFPLIPREDCRTPQKCRVLNIVPFEKKHLQNFLGRIHRSGWIGPWTSALTAFLGRNGKQCHATQNINY